MSSVNMTAVSVFKRELDIIKNRVTILEVTDTGDPTDLRIAENEIFDLVPVIRYLENRIKDLS